MRWPCLAADLNLLTISRPDGASTGVPHILLCITLLPRLFEAAGSGCELLLAPCPGSRCHPVPLVLSRYSHAQESLPNMKATCSRNFSGVP